MPPVEWVYAHSGWKTMDRTVLPLLAPSWLRCSEPSLIAPPGSKVEYSACLRLTKGEVARDLPSRRWAAEYVGFVLGPEGPKG